MIIYLLFPHLTGFFICGLYPWVLLLLLLAFLTFDLQLGKGTFFFLLVWKALSIRTWLSHFVTQIPEEKSGTSVWIKNGTDILALGAFTSAKSKPTLLMLRGQRSGFKGPAGLAPGCVGSTSLSLWNMGESPVSWASASSDTGAVWTWWAEPSCRSRDVSWPSDVLFYYLPSSKSLEAGWIFSFFRGANGSSGILTWVVRGWKNSRIGGEMEPGSVCPALLPGYHAARGMPLPVSVNGNGSALGIWGNEYQLGAEDWPLFSDFHLFLPLWPLQTKRHVLGNTWLCNMFFSECVLFS